MYDRMKNSKTRCLSFSNRCQLDDRIMQQNGVKFSFENAIRSIPNIIEEITNKTGLS